MNREAMKDALPDLIFGFAPLAQIVSGLFLGPFLVLVLWLIAPWTLFDGRLQPVLFWASPGLTLMFGALFYFKGLRPMGTSIIVGILGSVIIFGMFSG